MTSAPIEDAYAALCTVIATALLGAEFVADAGAVAIDPAEVLEPGEGSNLLETSAAIVQGDTKPIRTFIGGPAPRYAVEREVMVELAATGPDKTVRDAAMIAAVTALCSVPGSSSVAGGGAEDCEITDQQAGDLPPNGLKRIVTFALRVRAGDPLGLTPA